MRKIIKLIRGGAPKPPERRKREVGEEIVRSIIAPAGPVQIAERDPSWRIIESYYIYKPFVKVVIAETDTGPKYFVEEYGLTPADMEVLKKLTEILLDEIRPPTRPEDIKDLKGYVFREAERIADKYKTKLGLVGSRRIKLLYYIERNLLGYGPIDPLLRDPNIEDISCNGVGIPIYVWHKKYESIPTNITFVEEDYLNEFIMKLAHMAGKHISIAFPILDAMLPGRHRLAATFGREVSVKGPSFTIRKFRERPFSVTEIIQSGEINSLAAAYLWTLIEHGKTAMIAGGTGTGKSFPGDTKIIARINGKPVIIEASQLYSMIKAEEYHVGEHIVKDVNDYRVEVLSIGDDYKLSWRKLKRVIKHKDTRPLVRVRTNTSIITTTIDHNFIKIDPRTLDLIPVKASELKPGDYIVNAWLDTEYDGVSGISVEYAYFLGLWSGDGYLDKSNESIGFTTSSEYLVNRYKMLVKRLFNRDVNIVIDKRNNVKILTFHHDKLYNTLSDLFDHKKSYTIRVPYEILFNKDKSVLLAYLAGLLDSDGSIYMKTHKGKSELIIEYSSRSLELINGVSFMLKRLRIHHVVKIRNIKGKPVYRILIYGLEALKLLMLLKHYTAIPLESLIETAEKYYFGKKHNPNYDVYPISDYLVRIRESLGLSRKTVEKVLKLSDRYLRQYEYGRRRPSIGILERLYAYYSEKLDEKPSSEAKKLLDKLRKLMDGDIYVEKIITIEEVKPTDEYLYDLEVEDTHNFVIGQVGWRLNHNTTLLNVISMFIRPGQKIVTIEDTPEINLPHPNWVQLTSRETYLVGSSSAGTNIRLFDLVKLSLRYRPDYIIVGEIRGEEAFVLFQAMASVSGDTPILIKKPGEEISIVRISEFADKYYSGDEEWIPKKVNDYYVLSHNGYRVVWKPVKYVLRHRVGEIYEIEYEGGSIKATGNHSVFVFDPDTLDIVEKPVMILEKGEYLVSFNKTNINNNYQYIDASKYLLGEPGIYTDRIPSKIKKLANNKNPILLTQYITLKSRIHGKLDESKTVVKYLDDKYKLPLKILLDEKLAFLLGAYIAYRYEEDCRRDEICLSMDREKGERITEIIAEKFHIEPEVTNHNDKLVYRYKHPLLALLLKKLVGEKRLRIPDELWLSPRSVVKSFIEGLSSSINESIANYTSSNKELIEQLVWLTHYTGFESRIENTGSMYRLHVILNEHYGRRIPVKPLLRLLEYAELSNSTQILELLENKELIDTEEARQIVEYIELNGKLTDTSREYMRRLKGLINGDIVLVKIKDIVKKEYNGYVYDLSVPETESFYGGIKPVLLHNTGHGGLSTIHAETLDYAVKRLTSPPMNISPPYIKLMNVFIHLKRVITRIEKGVIKVERRVTTIQEVEDYGKYIDIITWDPKTDRFNVRLENSIHLRDIAEKRGLDLEDIIDEIYRKATVLNWMLMKNITNVWDVSRIIFDYYYDPATVYKRAVEELEEAGKKTIEAIAPAATATEVGETEELVSGTREMGEATKELFERTRELGK